MYMAEKFILKGVPGLYQEFYKELERAGIVRSAVFLSGKNAGRRVFFRKEDNISFETGIGSMDGEEIFAEVCEKNPSLVILGGGHVSRPVAKIGKMLGFSVTVMDDREDFVTEERFPDADMRIVGGFEEIEEKIPVYDNSYYVVVTRGHQGDTICARQILKRPYTYFGMIGSRQKVKTTRQNLLAEGFSEEQINTIHAPIGLPIGGQTPEEIAVSIMAEIVQVKNQRKASFPDEEIAREVLSGASGVMMTIIRKEGSSPRGIGSRMFLREDGKAFGTIGGGTVEYMAMQKAPSIGKTEREEYRLTNQDASSTGMICGGIVEVLFERVEGK